MCGIYLRASLLTFPRAKTAASLTSVTSQRKSGTINLYSAEGDTFMFGVLLSFLSALKLSGEEL